MATKRAIRYAVIGQGYFAQSTVLPAFAGAPNSELVAIVSDDLTKQDELGRKYEVDFTLSCDDLDGFLFGGAVDAIYITAPSHMHKSLTVRAARAGVHVLSEKPMALTEHDCQEMIHACEQGGVKLMIGYRLHFDPANLEAVRMARAGELGDLRAFTGAFTMQVHPGNHRLDGRVGGGPLYDLGVYCINAARYIFADEPTDVMAFSATRADDARFRDVNEQLTVAMRFPGDRLASFVTGFGSADSGWFEVLGSRGRLRLDPAFDAREPLKLEATIDGKTRKKAYGRHDQVAAELLYFSDCILAGRYPEPSGVEGLADVRIIQAIEAAARTGRSVGVEPVIRRLRPEATQAIQLSSHRAPKLVHAEPPSRH